MQAWDSSFTLPPSPVSLLLFAGNCHTAGIKMFSGVQEQSSISIGYDSYR